MAVDATQLSDEELLARRDAWGLERPDLLRAVAACKGEEYRQAYAAFMERKADAEGVVAAIRTRGLVRPGRPRNDGAPPDSGRRHTDFAFSFSVEQSARHFVARSDGYVRLPEY